ncbi:hypothetical protein Dsin_023403 [Dipteronia sinensis]|uniref:Pre-nudix hydrolase domain-containing protein n=1 Tax=Dipteronia sinensis TaxID=43782 RepID=A0AAE0E0Q9_9ROSI|nr:hypothetical protein Dsin_023403 [Dipteronia sinensis]
MQVFENGVVEHVKLLEVTNDEHGGVIVEMVEPMDPQAFATVLTASMLHWKHQEIAAFTSSNAEFSFIGTMILISVACSAIQF